MSTSESSVATAIEAALHAAIRAPSPHNTGDYADVLLEHGRRWLREAGDAAPTVEITIELRDGITKDLIEEFATARMLVLGSRGLGGFAELRTGSIAVGVAAHAHCPVVVIRSSTQDGAPPRTGAVVVGVDGSAWSNAAVAFAFEAAAARALVRNAATAQLVVVGSRGRGALVGLGLGSVSQHLLHHAPCPVAIIWPEESGP